MRCSRGAKSARARLSIQKSCASPASKEPHDIALARRADIKDRKSLFTRNLFQVQPCTSYISPQLRSNSSVPIRRKAGSDLVVNRKRSALQSESRTHAVRCLSTSSSHLSRRKESSTAHRSICSAINAPCFLVKQEQTPSRY